MHVENAMLSSSTGFQAVNTGCDSELWPFRVMDQCSADKNHLHVVSWGRRDQVSGVMVLVQESISYTHSFNQHSTARSALEKVMHCCTTATHNIHQGSAQTEKADINTNRGRVWVPLQTQHWASKGRNFIFFWLHKSQEKWPTIFIPLMEEECILLSLM